MRAELSAQGGMLVVMAICLDCDQEMQTGASCTVSTLHLAGAPVPVPRHGADGAPGPRDRRCDDCGVEPGGLHHLGCDLQPCPSCHRQLLSCGCPFDELGGADDEVDDEPDVDDDGAEDDRGSLAPVTGLSTDNPCPRCGSRRVIPILYGLPHVRLAVLAEQGLVELAGAIFDGDQPTSRCRDCEHGWSRRAG